MLIRLFANGMLAATAVLAVSALAVADETIIEKRTHETQREVEVVPEVKERVIEERTVTQDPPVVRKRTDETVVTTNDNDDDDDDDNDND